MRGGEYILGGGSWWRLAVGLFWVVVGGSR